MVYEVVVVDIVLNISKANADKKEIKLKVIYCDNMPDLLEIDKSRLTQIVMNLVGNAIKFTPEKGTVTVKVNWKYKEEHNEVSSVLKQPLGLFSTDPKQVFTIEKLKDESEIKEARTQKKEKVSEERRHTKWKKFMNIRGKTTRN